MHAVPVTETIDHLIIALDNGYISEATFDKFKADCDECAKMINGYKLFT
ncbi:four helix bundle protein [Mucilaginibacter auburnensis]|nr:four helix bundle protein [Mucilaginibacter auburnensis]